MNAPLFSISPIDGRYASQTAALQEYFSEMSLMKYRCLIEIWYFVELSKEKKIKEFPSLSKDTQEDIWSLVPNFLPQDARKIKQIEKRTNHDVKAIEYFLRKELSSLACARYTNFLHFALTSEDVNNISYTLLWRDAIKEVYLPLLKKLHVELQKLSREWSDIALLSLTHGQSATPTTLGKEFAVYAHRLASPIQELQRHIYTAKLNGASGTWAAHRLAYPDIDWLAFSKRFIKNLGLRPNLYTTQVEGSDSLAASFLILFRINTILTDLTRDAWLYCSRGVFQLQRKKNEVGSSTMPHKVNPIHFENAEGNLGIANANLAHLAGTLPISRLQRDLSGSTLIRTIGVPLAHSLIACHSIVSGIERITPNTAQIYQELDEHWEVLAEAIQIILRKNGREDAYEIVKEKTRGHTFSQKDYHKVIESLPLPLKDKKNLMRLTPHTYIGYAKKLSR